MSKKTFKLSHSESTRASAASVFSIWADVSGWPRWDLGLQACELGSDFSVGGTIKLTPRGAPEAVHAKIEEMIEGEKFVDVTELPFGTLKAIHEVAPKGKGSVVTHTIVAEIAAEQADFFANVIWKNFEEGLAPSVKALTQLAEKSA